MCSDNGTDNLVENRGQSSIAQGCKIIEIKRWDAQYGNLARNRPPPDKFLDQLVIVHECTDRCVRLKSKRYGLINK